MNPELQRYLWLELTPHRLVATPVLLLAIFGLVDLLSGDDALRAMAVTAYWVVIVLGVLWGGRAASEAVVAEVVQGTWDQQRLSSLGPWSMTWAKLIGAPVFTWYACLPCLVLIAAGPRAGAAPADAVYDALLLATIVLFAHAMGLMAGLHLAARGAKLEGRSVMGLHLVALGCALPMLAASMAAFHDGGGGSVDWFATRFSARGFVFASIGLFTAWAILGCYRLMRAELQLRTAPWVWVCFVVFCMTYAAGLGWSDARAPLVVLDTRVFDAPGAALVSAHLVALGLAYLMLLVEAKDPVAWRRLLDAAGRGELRTALELLPRWLCTAVLAALSAFAVLALDRVGRVLCLSTLVFLARDAGLVVLLNLGARRARADAAALLYLAVLYVLAPAIVAASGGGNPAGWLLPAVHGSLLVAVLPGALQAAALWAAVRVRWQRYRVAWG